MEYKIKIITGFRQEQYYVIDANEAHKAYYLFNNPEKRGVFNNGVALIGKNIQGIEPAYNETMGWKPTHVLDGDDWEEINLKGVGNQMKKLMSLGKEISYQINSNPSLLNQNINEIQDNLMLK